MTAAAALMALAGVAGEAQRVPDLSGQWELVERSGGTGGDRHADSLTINEIRATTTAAGAAMAPALLALQIARRTGVATTTREIQIGIEGGVTGGAAGGGRTEAQSRWSTRWVDDHLVVWHLERTVAPERTVEVETTEDWSINEAGHLVIATLVRKTGQDSVRTTATYRHP